MEGVDKYCCAGINPREAGIKVTNSLKQAFNSNAKLVVVIIDTCGESQTSDIVFGLNFSGWQRHKIMVNLFDDNDKKLVKDYLCWTLHNVLKRTKHSPTTPYWLEPESASVLTCLSVHTKKSQSILQKKAVKVTNKSTFGEIINDIEEGSIRYQKYLDDNHPLEQTISEILIYLN
jgi:hypothetical protein